VSDTGVGGAREGARRARFPSLRVKREKRGLCPVYKMCSPSYEPCFLGAIPPDPRDSLRSGLRMFIYNTTIYFYCYFYYMPLLYTCTTTIYSSTTIYFYCYLYYILLLLLYILLLYILLLYVAGGHSFFRLSFLSQGSLRLLFVWNAGSNYVSHTKAHRSLDLLRGVWGACPPGKKRSKRRHSILYSIITINEFSLYTFPVAILLLFRLLSLLHILVLLLLLDVLFRRVFNIQ
jgi:hypothetical protein